MISFMKALWTIILPVLFLAACNKDSHFDDSHLVNVGSGGAGIPSENCTDEALIALNSITSLCDRDLSKAADKELCVSGAEAYKKDFPNVVCNLEGEVVVAEKFIEEELSPTPTPEKKDPVQELIDSGIFDE